MGYWEYEPIAARHHVPIVVTGFEPVDLLEGILRCVQQLETGRAEVENAYARVVRREGNLEAQALVREVFRVVSRKWRGIGEIADSGLAFTEAYADLDAERRFDVQGIAPAEPAECISGLVLQGRRKPRECSAFGTRCTPEQPLGATMVSSEGACAAYYRYGRREAAKVS
jgi:hydrogenase expression/formation protein HypD